MRATVLALCAAATFLGLVSGALAGEVKQQKILMLGDSITDRGLPAAVSGPLNELTKGRVVWTLVNGGKGGETAEGGKARIAALVEAEKPDVVTVSYGTNDLGKGHTSQQFRDNLLGIIDLVGQRAPATKVILLTHTPFVDTQPSFTATLPAMEMRFEAVTRQIAAEKGLPLADLLRQFMSDQAWEKYLLPDHAHLNPEGYKFSGRYLAEVIAAWYAAEVDQDPQAVEKRDQAVAKLKAVADSIKEAKRPEVRVKLLAELETIWRSCPYLPAHGAVWHAVWHADPVAVLNRQIERFNVDWPAGKVVALIDRRVSRVEYVAAEDSVRCYDQDGGLLMTMKRKADGIFVGVVQVKLREPPNPPANFKSAIWAPFFLPRELFKRAEEPGTK